MIIAIDFDGTCVTHEFPHIGQNIGAGPVLRALQRRGHSLVLNTMRSHRKYDDIDTLQEAYAWFTKEGITLSVIDDNGWTDSNKICANLYIDDRNLGCPMTVINKHYFVDWVKVTKMLCDRDILNNEDFLSISQDVIRDRATIK